jgi:heme exporter protein C
LRHLQTQPNPSILKKGTRLAWWKILCMMLLANAVITGMLMPVPAKAIINESIRNLYYHVPMWIAMMVLMSVSVVNAIKYLRNAKLEYDIASKSYGSVGSLFGLLGISTGAIWANYTWGKPWSGDIKQNLAAIALLIYASYFVLRSSIDDIDKRARISAIYNIFAYVMLFPLLFILPRLTDSLHPGGEGNPALNKNDIDPMMDLLLVPTLIGWSLLGVWIASLQARYTKLRDKDLLN